MPYRTKAPDDGSRLYNAVLRAERAFIARALLAHAHNRTRTAQWLGIARRTLLNKIKSFGLRTRADVNGAAHDVAATVDLDLAMPTKETDVN